MGKSKTLIIVSALFAATIWGAWAYYVNVNKGDSDLALRTAIAQAAYSAVMTLYMSISVIFIAKKTKDWKHKKIWPVLGTAGHTGSALILVHYFNHTPALLKTVSLPIFITVIYCSILTRKYYAQ